MHDWTVCKILLNLKALILVTVDKENFYSIVVLYKSKEGVKFLTYA